jgi:hypothetical protein
MSLLKIVLLCDQVDLYKCTDFLFLDLLFLFVLTCSLLKLGDENNLCSSFSWGN